jgi:S-adenosylmethionine hydrolase
VGAVRYRCLTLLTDYGSGGGFVGALHAVAFSIAPDLPVIDLDHSIPRHDVRLGSLRLARMMRYVPPGVHVGVVDPGVGTQRRAIALATAARIFVGPDNGLLTPAAFACAGEAAGGAGEALHAPSAFVLDDERWFLSPRSSTFDGRDVFVPVAAHLAGGAALSDIGSPVAVESVVRLPDPVAELAPDGGSATVEVLQVDGFGNVQLAGGPDLLAQLGLATGAVVSVVKATTSSPPVEAPVGRAFGDVETGAPVVLVDSDGCLAVSVNGGRADALLGLAGRPGETVRLSRIS